MRKLFTGFILVSVLIINFWDVRNVYSTITITTEPYVFSCPENITLSTDIENPTYLNWGENSTIVWQYSSNNSCYPDYEYVEWCIMEVGTSDQICKEASTYIGWGGSQNIVMKLLNILK